MSVLRLGEQDVLGKTITMPLAAEREEEPLHRSSSRMANSGQLPRVHRDLSAAERLVLGKAEPPPANDNAGETAPKS